MNLFHVFSVITPDSVSVKGVDTALERSSQPHRLKGGMKSTLRKDQHIEDED
jgi:hypothetical protein